MFLLGCIIALHGAIIFVCTAAGAAGYVQRKSPRSAVGAMLTVGIASVCEIAFGAVLMAH